MSQPRNPDRDSGLKSIRDLFLPESRTFYGTTYGTTYEVHATCHFRAGDRRRIFLFHDLAIEL
jgi:hypothetical protein